MDIRQKGVSRTPGKTVLFISAFLCHKITFYRRRRRTKDHAGSCLAGAEQRHFIAVITGNSLADVAVFMLLIQNNGSQSFKRSKQCRSGTDHNVQFSHSGALILVIALPLRESGMNDRNPFAECLAKPRYGLEGQGDLRDQYNCLLSLCQYSF